MTDPGQVHRAESPLLEQGAIGSQGTTMLTSETTIPRAAPVERAERALACIACLQAFPLRCWRETPNRPYKHPWLVCPDPRCRANQVDGPGAA